MSNIQEWDANLPKSPYLIPTTFYSNSNLETTSLNSDVIPMFKKYPSNETESNAFFGNKSNNDTIIGDIEEEDDYDNIEIINLIKTPIKTSIKTPIKNKSTHDEKYST